MFTSILIIGFSLILFAYWFRYTCLLILETRTTKDYSGEVIRANQLSYNTVLSKLEQGASNLEELQPMLDRDFEVVTCLYRYAANFQIGGIPLEERMLMLDYRLMRTWYSVTREISAPQARKALDEMSQIVGHFANSLGERAAGGADA